MSEADERALECLRHGHTLTPWRIRLFGVLHIRLLCSRCGLSFLPATIGHGTVPLAS
jgi:hypothetical protein